MRTKLMLRHRNEYIEFETVAGPALRLRVGRLTEDAPAEWAAITDQQEFERICSTFIEAGFKAGFAFAPRGAEGEPAPSTNQTDPRERLHIATLLLAGLNAHDGALPISNVQTALDQADALLDDVAEDEAVGALLKDAHQAQTGGRGIDGSDGV